MYASCIILGIVLLSLIRVPSVIKVLTMLINHLLKYRVYLNLRPNACPPIRNIIPL